MYEWLSSPAEPRTWPGFPEGAPSTTDDQVTHPAPHQADQIDHAGRRVAAIADVIVVTSDTRRLSYICAGLLAADLVGVAAVGSALAASGRPLALGSVALLLPVFACWLVTALLVLVSETPMARALGRLRRTSGAPVDPSAPWWPVGVEPLTDAEMTWSHVVPLIAAADHQHARARVALSAAFLTTVAFLLWMALSLAAITLI